nr:hypothetical protein [Parapedobacter defluvii]
MDEDGRVGGVNVQRLVGGQYGKPEFPFQLLNFEQSLSQVPAKAVVVEHYQIFHFPFILTDEFFQCHVIRAVKCVATFPVIDKHGDKFHLVPFTIFPDAALLVIQRVIRLVSLTYPDVTDCFHLLPL